MSVDGGAPAVLIANGLFPALSPDGTELACVRTAANPSGFDTVTVSQLATGRARVVVTAQHSADYESFSELSWAPDNRHLAVDVSGEGFRSRRVDVFDTGAPVTAAEPGSFGFRATTSTSEWWAPTFLPDGGLFIGEAVYGAGNADNPSVERLVSIDPETAAERRVVTTGPFDSLGGTATDTSGEHLLFVSQPAGVATLMVSDNRAQPVPLARDIAYAAW